MAYTQPQCLGITLCDHVIEDKRTNKKSYIGVFNDVWAIKLPVNHPCIYVVVTLTGCLGHQQITLQISHEVDYGEEKILQVKGQFEARSPVDIVDIIFELRQTPLKAYGKYNIEIHSFPQGTRLIERGFNVKPPPKQQP